MQDSGIKNSPLRKSTSNLAAEYLKTNVPDSISSQLNANDGLLQSSSDCALASIQSSVAQIISKSELLKGFEELNQKIARKPIERIPTDEILLDQITEKSPLFFRSKTISDMRENYGGSSVIEIQHLDEFSGIETLRLRNWRLERALISGNEKLQKALFSYQIAQQEKLSLETELEELTRSLFEEANKLVSTEARRRFDSEKKLTELQPCVELLDEELKELKKKMYAMEDENKHLQSALLKLHSVQSLSNGDQKKSSIGDIFNFKKRSGHQRSKSESTSLQENSNRQLPTSPTLTSPVNEKEKAPSVLGSPSSLHSLEAAMELSISPASLWSPPTLSTNFENLVSMAYSHGLSSLDSVIFQEFEVFLHCAQSFVDPVNASKDFEIFFEEKILDCAFMKRCFDEDIKPNITFQRNNMKWIFNMIKSNALIIEKLPAQLFVHTMCQMSLSFQFCKYKYIYTKTSQSTQNPDPDCWNLMGEPAYFRIVSVIEFYNYVRYICQGIVKSDMLAIYCKTMLLRKNMSLAKLGLPFEL